MNIIIACVLALGFENIAQAESWTQVVKAQFRPQYFSKTPLLSEVEFGELSKADRMLSENVSVLSRSLSDLASDGTHDVEAKKASLKANIAEVKKRIAEVRSQLSEQKKLRTLPPDQTQQERIQIWKEWVQNRFRTTRLKKFVGSSASAMGEVRCDHSAPEVESVASALMASCTDAIEAAAAEPEVPCSEVSLKLNLHLERNAASEGSGPGVDVDHSIPVILTDVSCRHIQDHFSSASTQREDKITSILAGKSKEILSQILSDPNTRVIQVSTGESNPSNRFQLLQRTSEGIRKFELWTCKPGRICNVDNHVVGGEGAVTTFFPVCGPNVMIFPPTQSKGLKLAAKDIAALPCEAARVDLGRLATSSTSSTVLPPVPIACRCPDMPAG